MSDASVVATIRDGVSPGLNRMRDANQGFGRSMEEVQRKSQQYAQKLDEQIRLQAKLQLQLDASKKELKTLKDAFGDVNDAVRDPAVQEAQEKYNRLKHDLDSATRAVRETDRALQGLNETSRKSGASLPGGTSRRIDSAAGTGVSGTDGLAGRFGKSGAASMVGSLLSQVADTYIESQFGSSVGSYVSSALSSAGSGAAIGTAIAPGIGTVVGAALGGLGGLLTAHTEQYAEQDDVFKSYVQDAATGALQERADAIASGSATAAQREQDEIAFNRLLGDGIGSRYLEDLRVLAASTPMEYSDLTSMSRALATGFGESPDRMLELMEAIGDAGSAIGIDASGMTEMARSLSRMESSGKATLEYLNIFQDRGVDVIGMLSNGLGKTQEEIYDMISKSEIRGVDAVNIIQRAMEDMYDGAMEKQSQTFSGLTSTLSDAQTEMENAYGEGYNETRKAGLQAEIDYLTGESGEMMQEANRAIGAFYAEQENERERMIRAAQKDVMETVDYKNLMAQGTDEAYAEAGMLLMAAKIQGQNEYNASDGAQLLLASEEALVGKIRNNTSLDDQYWNAGYRKGIWYSKGRAAAMADTGGAEAYTTEEDWLQASIQAGRGQSHAYGLQRVPYDNYPALLHEGERVLTASEARRADAGQAASVLITGNTFSVREEADIDRIAGALAEKLQAAMMTGVR